MTAPTYHDLSLKQIGVTWRMVMKFLACAHSSSCQPSWWPLCNVHKVVRFKHHNARLTIIIFTKPTAGTTVIHKDSYSNFYRNSLSSFLDKRKIGTAAKHLTTPLSRFPTVTRRPIDASIQRVYLLGYKELSFNIQGDPKRCVPIFCSIKNPLFNECLFCCRAW